MPSREAAEALANKLLGQNSGAMYGGDADAVDLLASSAKMGVADDDDDGSDDESDDEVSNDEEEIDGEEEADDEEGADDEAPEEDADEEADDDEEEEADGDGDDDTAEFDYSDDDTIEVLVDGEVEEVSIKALKAAYSGEGAIQKRLKQATEARKAANAEREKAQQEIEAYRNNLMTTVQNLDQVLFLPLIEKPDPKLRARNINQYLMEQDAYNEDQKRIAELRGAVSTYFQQQQSVQQQARTNYRADQQKMLVEKMPELRDPQKAGFVRDEIMSAASYYGFTPEQVASVDNHGLFLMARDAARWLNLQKIKQNGTRPTSGTMKVKRRLRGGGVSQTKARVQAEAKAKRSAEVQAAKTGSVDDVTNFLIAGAKHAAKQRSKRFDKP